MKKILLSFALFSVIFLLLIGCSKKDAQLSGGGDKDAGSALIMDKDTSYAFGMALASQFKDTGMRFDYGEFTQGFKDFIENEKTRIPEDEARTKAQEAYMRAMDATAEAYKQKETEFLAANAQKSGVIVTPSGLQYEVITAGSGAKPLASDTVRVHYEGTLIDGTVFDSSYQRGEPIEFPLNGVIPGWTEGLQLMPIGSTYMLYIPSNLAYGGNGAGKIPPYSALTFKVELLDIVKQ